MAQPAEHGCVATPASSSGNHVSSTIDALASDPTIGPMPIRRRLSHAERARLVVEILTSYRMARKYLPSNVDRAGGSGPAGKHTD